MIKKLRHWHRYGLSLLYPLECVICGTPLSPRNDNAQFLCSDCTGKIKFISSPVCGKCGRPAPNRSRDKAGKTPLPQRCSECNKMPLFFDTVSSVALYDSVWREIIHIFKYRKGEYLDRFLAESITGLIEKNESLKEYDFLIPVPLHWLDRWGRGYNQAYLLAHQVSKLTGKPLLNNMLIKSKRAVSQTQLSRKERLKNVKGAFTVKNHGIVKDKRVLLIDDVFTTGSTVSECAKVLKKAGAQQVSVVTLAHG